MCCCPKKIEKYWEIVKKIQKTGTATEQEKQFLAKMTNTNPRKTLWHSV